MSSLIRDMIHGELTDECEPKNSRRNRRELTVGIYTIIHLAISRDLEGRWEGVDGM